MKDKKCRVIDKITKTETFYVEKDFIELVKSGIYGDNTVKKYFNKNKKMYTYVIYGKFSEQ